jgi:hypothetical protein
LNSPLLTGEDAGGRRGSWLLYKKPLLSKTDNYYKFNRIRKKQQTFLIFKHLPHPAYGYPLPPGEREE